MMPLLSALENLGVRVIESTSGKCPFTIQGPINGWKNTRERYQFTVSYSLADCLSAGPEDTEITVENLNERPYVEITLDWLRQMGIRFEQKGLDWFRIYGGQQYNAFERSDTG